MHKGHHAAALNKQAAGMLGAHDGAVG